jgi:valyl-tRNA synthetase
MGHALCYPLQDLLGRYKRLKGYNVLILPGQDHAGIATQTVVTKNLKKKGIQPHEIGRDAFVEHVWEWRHESGNTILNQFRALGCAFDWSKLRFTLDQDYAQAVLKVFIDWYEKGLIYKGLRVINWDPTLKTSVSDIETERKITQGKLYHIKYPFSDGTGHITIATTRPETMLADVAVAVNPKDERYQSLIGKTLSLPLTNREIPLIADEYPDPEFGTGAVKVTPAHDPNDFEIGKRHNLPILFMMDERAKVTELGGIYQGLDRFEARKKVVQDLEEQGFLEKIEDHEIALIISDRSKDVIEPYASEQWFVNQTELAKEAIRVVENGQIQFHPARYKEVYLDWMNNIRDWCISRQLWWGHRIPIYYTESGKTIAALNWEDAQAKAGEDKILRQDDDVLDTWFSSGLWPFATLGWPQSETELKQYYPTDVLVTSREILYLWVARMIMMGMSFIGEIPFRNVYIYATVLTEDGKRMSKSLGTGVDPMEVIETKGADAIRYTLFAQTGLNQDLRYSEKRTTEARAFCNKVWNASRFVLMNLEGFVPGKPMPEPNEFDQWILSRLAHTEREVTEGIDQYDIQRAVAALTSFFWNELCDWYIEVSKGRLQQSEERDAPQWVLFTCLEAYLKMLHPILPFVTEEVYSLLPGRTKGEFLMASEWPEIPEDWANPSLEAKVSRLLETTRAMRALRAELGLAPGRVIPEANYEGDLQGGEKILASQAWITTLKSGKPSEGKFVSTTVNGIDLHLTTAQLIDESKELQRLANEATKLEAELVKVELQLNNPQFIEKAKPDLVEKAKSQKQEILEKLAKNKDRQKLFNG